MATKKIARMYDDNGNRLYTDAVDIIDRTSGANFSEHVANKDMHAQWAYNTGSEEDTNAKAADAPEGAIFIENNSVLKQKVNGVAEAVQLSGGSKITYGTTDPGVGSALETGSIYLVYE